MKCEYGCNQEANFQLKNKKWCCCISYNSCKAIKKKNSDSIKKAHKEGRISSWPERTRYWWLYKSKKEVKEIRQRQGKTYSKNKQNGLHKENLGGFKNIKYYSIFCKFLKQNVNVHGLWEYKFANYLNKKNINWTNKTFLKYNDKNKKERTYYPDFYLPDFNKYIEIKGKWKIGKKDSKEKMFFVKRSNHDKKISILEYNDLIKLGIKIYD